MPGVRNKQGDVWMPNEAVGFLGVAEGDGMAHVWRLAVEKVPRTSGVSGVSSSDFDTGARTIRLGRQVVRLDHGYPIIREGGKTAAAERVNYLTPELVEVLREHRKAQTIRRLAAPEWIDNGLIFCTRSGKPHNASNFRRSFDGIGEDAGVRNIGPHGMRRTVVTLAIAGTGDVKSIAEMVGHRDVSMTLQTYHRVTRGASDELRGIMASIVRATPKPVDDVPVPLDVGAS